MRKAVIRIAWYRPRDWQRLREIAADANIIEESHAEWRYEATRVLRQLERQGVRVRKVIIDLDELTAFCRKRRVPIDAAARSSFVAERVHQEELPRGETRDPT
jgi:hypothetical protein